MSSNVCNVTHKQYNRVSVQECPNKAVIFRYGINGKAYVSYPVCYKCKYGKTEPLIGGVSCTHERGEANG